MGTSESSSSRRRIPWWIWPLLFIAIVFGSWLIWNLQMDAAIEREIQAIRDAGYPATPEELNDWYAYPEGDNAADIYQQAFADLIEPGDADRDLIPIIGPNGPPGPGKPWPNKVLVATERFLASNKLALEKLHEAAAIEPSRYPVDFTQGINALLPALGDVRFAAQTLCLQAMRRADRDDLDGAVDSLIAAQAIARSLRDEPTLVSHLVEIAVMAFFYQETEALLRRHDLTPAQRGRLADAAAATWLDHGMVGAMAGERAAVFAFLGDPAIFNAWWSSAYQYAGLLKRDKQLYLQLMRRYVEAAEKPLVDQIVACDAAAGRAGRIPKTYPFARMAIPALGKAMVIHHRVIASRSMTLVALALLDYNEAKGRLPDKLDDLVPEHLDDVPLDTFTGKPIEYERINDESFILFSPGELGVTVPPKGDPARIDFIRQLEDYEKFQYRVPADSPLRAVEEEEE